MGNSNNSEVFELLLEDLLDEILSLEIDAIFWGAFSLASGYPGVMTRECPLAKERRATSKLK